jgi:hypothetical protein
MNGKMTENHVADLTVEEFRHLVREVVKQTLNELLDPDAGLLLREDLEAELKTSLQSVVAGGETIPIERVAADLGLEW